MAEMRLGAIATFIDYRGKTPPKSPTGVKLLTAKVIKDGAIDESRLEYISEETYAHWMRRGLPMQGDVLLTTEAPLGQSAMLRSAEKIALAQRVILLRGHAGQLDQHYLFAAVRSPLVQARLRQRATGTTVPGIKQSELRQVEIPLPALSAQRKIAAIVSAYDDLLENNKRRIKLLAAMAQRIFREWFVEFRYPGHENVPLVASELGPIPEGWQIKRMDEVADVVDCLHSKKPEGTALGPGLLLQLFNIGSHGILDLSQTFRISSAAYALWTSRIELAAGDCVVTNVGRVAAVAQMPPGLVAAPGRNMTVIRPHGVPPTYLLQYLLSEHMAREVHLKKDAGAIMDSLNVKGIVKLAVPVPGHDLAAQFERLGRPIRREMEVLTAQLNGLRAARDLLLPRLISGQIDVTDVDITLSDAAA